MLTTPINKKQMGREVKVQILFRNQSKQHHQRVKNVTTQATMYLLSVKER